MYNFGILINSKSIQSVVKYKDKTALLDILKSIFAVSKDITEKSLYIDDTVFKKPQHEENILSQNHSNNSLTEVYPIGNITLNNISSTKTPTKAKQNKLTNMKQTQSNLTNVNHLGTHEEIIDLDDKTLHKPLEKTESTLDFFINSLSKSLEMKPRQVAALISNKHKYLIQIASKGIKGNFSKIQKWIQELSFHIKHLITLVRASKDLDHTRNMTFSTLAVGFFSKNKDIADSTRNLISNLQMDLGTDWEWLISDGVISFFAAVDRHKEIRNDILRLLSEMAIHRYQELFSEIGKLQSERVFEFLGNVVQNINQITSLEFKNSLGQG